MKTLLPQTVLHPSRFLTVRLGNTLQLIFLLDGVGSGGTLSSVDQLLGQTLSNGLDVSERSLTSTNGQESNSLVDSSQWGDINSLSSDGTGRTNSGGIFSWTGVDNSINENLQWVLVGQNVDDLQSVLDDSDSFQLLTVVSTVHHKRVGQTLNDWTLGLSESLGSVTTGSVGDESWLGDLDVVGQGDVLDGNFSKRPLVEQLDLSLSLLNVSWDGGSQLNKLDLNWLRDDLEFLLGNFLLWDVNNLFLSHG